MSYSNDREKGCSILEKLDNYTVIDLETTGFNVCECEIIEMSAVRVRNNQIVDTYTTLVNPQEKITNEVVALTGITNEMVETAPTIYECIEDFIVFIGNDILLGHNIASFDSNILYDNALYTINYKLENDYLDTLRFIKYCNLELPNYKLTTLQEHLGVINEAQHRSLSDCIATHECYQKMKPLFMPTSIKKPKATAKSSTYMYSSDTQNIIMLKGLLTGITCDDMLTESEVLSLHSWVNNNRQLAGTYPFDVVISEIDKALEDGILEKHELDMMLEIFKSLLDPVESFSEKCDCSDIDFSGKLVCLTGEFENFNSKGEAEKYLERKGAIIKKSVIKKLDYLIVGGCGNSNWSCGNYGNKVKKALELQFEGCELRILKEDEIW